ncbi:MAG: hypothetical protein M1834_005720 [Cirrosporium novae-zelandiae]|nr:MAG: hypothetical protein M1834_005720 [Cirrosporium novae-zelandiae]
MVYDWEGKEAICFRMYIQERKSLEEIMEYMKVAHQFTPSKRAFQTQFKRWQFPSKQNPAHKNPALVARVKELWEHNTSQRDMLRILNEEDGFDIKERELMRVRAKNRWLLRVPNGMKSGNQASNSNHPPSISPPVQQEQSTEDAALQVMGEMIQSQVNAMPSNPSNPADDPLPYAPSPNLEQEPELPPEVVQKRKERMAHLQAESASRWASRKRRRRTRGWAGLPADPPGPPRFPSETTIDESKHFLNLNNEMYKQIRDQFQHICEEAGFIKKTIAGPDRWQQAKDRLIHESPHLQGIFWGSNENLEAKTLALDVVCTDVTKRMRTLERRMTIAEAKNALGINPEESRQVRNSFYAILKADHFTSKLEAGDEHWRELKEQWIAGNPLLQQILSGGEVDHEYGTKIKAVEVLCRDVMKRLRDDQTKRDPTRPKTQSHNPSLSNSIPTVSPTTLSTTDAGISQLASQALASTPNPMSVSEDSKLNDNTYSDLQIDPSLLEAASANVDPRIQHPSFTDPFQFPPSDSYGLLAGPQPVIPVYFRLSPLSQIPAGIKFQQLWLATLYSRSVSQLRDLALEKYPGMGISKIQGLARDPNGSGQEMTYEIDEDDELDAYLTHVQGQKATFVVEVIGGGM